jgi:hypothetical protein
LTSTADLEKGVEMTGMTTERGLLRLVIAAAIGLVGCSGPEDTPRADKVATSAPAQAQETGAKEVATGFLEAYGAFDADRAIAYLADDATLSPLGVGGNREFRLLLSFSEAQGYKQMLAPCEETGSSSAGTYVRCPFDFHAIRSDEIGRGPYSGSYFEFTVRDGEIVRVSNYLEIARFSGEMWEPFADWVSTTYPEDAAVMYNKTLTDYRLSEESIRLWEKHSREYVDKN